MVGMLVPDHENVKGSLPPVTVALHVTTSPTNATAGVAEQVTLIGLPETTRSKLVCLSNGEPVTVIG